MDIGSIAATAKSIKSIADLIKTLSEMRNISEMQTAIVKLRNEIIIAQSHTLIAQSEQAAMVETIRTLKEETIRIKAWESEKQRYKLYSPWNGTVVYALKESMSNSEPPHWICTNCYYDGRKSILTQQQIAGRFVDFVCSRSSCNFKFRVVGCHKNSLLYPLKYV